MSFIMVIGQIHKRSTVLLCSLRDTSWDLLTVKLTLIKYDINFLR